MKFNELKEYILNGFLDLEIEKICNKNTFIQEKQRFLNLLEECYKRFGDGDFHFISSPGRSEIGGNHTDHQNGHVIATTLDIDNLVCFKANSDKTVIYYDKVFGEVKLDLSDLNYRDEEKNTTISLIRGIAYKLNELDYNIGGFNAICDSRVLGGSGISSSACFEVMITEVFSALYNSQKISPIERALVSKYAENSYFGKPSGLLDQLAISVGGFVFMNFKDPKNPQIENFDFSFNDYGYSFVLVNTKGDHSNLSNEYSAIPEEIKNVSNFLGKDVLADSDYYTLLNNIPDIRKSLCNDRAILRSIHFYNEDKRVIKQKDAIKNKNISDLLKLMNESGRSSFMYLQNVYPASRPKSQSLALALALSDSYLDGQGAFRVHGGGLDGTIQVILPTDMLEGYKELISPIFGDDAIMEVNARGVGTITII